MRRVCPAKWKVSKEYFRGVLDCSINTANSFIDMLRRSNIGDNISLKIIRLHIGNLISLKIDHIVTEL